MVLWLALKNIYPYYFGKCTNLLIMLKIRRLNLKQS